MTRPSTDDPFRSHLVALLSIYELGPFPALVPHYDGPADCATDSILRSIATLARRMYTAEESLASAKALDDPQANDPQAKTGHSAINPRSPSTSQIRLSLSSSSANTPTPVTLEGLPHSLDHLKISERAFGPSGNDTSTPTSPTSHQNHTPCTTCDKPVAETIENSSNHSPSSSLPLMVPMGPLATAAFENEMSAVEELRLLKAQISDVVRVCNAIARGDLSQKITVPVQGVVMIQAKDVVNTMVEILRQLAKEVICVCQDIETLSKFDHRAPVLDLEGTWREVTDVVNNLATSITSQVRSMAEVAKAVTLGDLSNQIQIDAHGEMLELKCTVNEMVVSLRVLAEEISRVLLEVGADRKLGGQAHVPHAAGVWFGLVGDVNLMCSAFSQQARDLETLTRAIL